MKSAEATERSEICGIFDAESNVFDEESFGMAWAISRISEFGNAANWRAT